MELLYPIASAETRHLFVDPSIYGVWDIIDPSYTKLGYRSGYLKPGKISNLVQLCRPKEVTFSVTEEIDLDDFHIEDILFCMHHDGHWQQFRVFHHVKVEKLDAGNWGLNGTLVIPTRQIINTETGEKGITIKGTDILNIELTLNYARGTRCLEFSTEGTYDNGKPQILGITLDMKYKDSKSEIPKFKTQMREVTQTYHREIVA